ncbi:MAG: FtsW/RodA/SpoVE family cell cycle protein [Gammaproteobacteria bacterium WSBS_2016_MAG_OTU1]
MQRNNDFFAFDVGIVIACTALLTIGMMAIYSVSLSQNTNWAEKQFVWAVLAAAAAAAMSSCSLSVLRRHARHLMALAICGLMAVFLFEAHNGAHRWISFGGWSLQPSEFFKWTALLATAYFASRAQYKIRQSVFIKPVALWVLAPLLIIALQRDFGALVLVATVTLIMLFLSGLDLRWIVFLCVLFIAFAVLMVLFEPYRMQRLTSFIDPFSALGGYNQKHSLIAFVLGGLWGSGVGRSIEKWGYLPEAHNDFIISIIAEENGLIGVLIVCSLLMFIAIRAFKIGDAAAARDETFGALYAYGFAAMLCLQSFVNIGGNLALLPLKGFTLPMVSYGGSSLLATGLMLGVLLRVDCENRNELLLAKTTT